MKQYVFSVVRWAHGTMARTDLPERVGAYFHELPRSDWDGFEAGVSRLLDLGYQSVALDDYLTEDHKHRRLFVSFDDNFEDWHSALGLFERLQLKVTFYVNTLPFRDTCGADEISAYFQRIAYTGAGRTLSTSQLKEIVAAGHEIGCHTHSHFKLSELPRQAWHAEIAECRDRLEQLIDRPVRHISYPYGMARFFSGSLRTYCKEIGFVSIASGAPGLLHVDPFDPFDIPRTRWRFNQSVDENMTDICIDGRLFTKLTGCSAVG